MAAFLIACFLVYTVKSGVVGPVTIKENGQSVTRYAVSTYPPLASVSGSSIMLKHDSQVQIAKTNEANYTSNSFAEYKLNGKTLSFTANISEVDCSCNAALYLVTMPGYGSNGKPDPGKSGDYYCDANEGNGEWCWEMDIMEANKYAIQITPHKCDQPPGC